MRRTVTIRLCPLWDVPLEEITRRARERSFQARQLAADRGAEDEFRARVSRNVVARELARAIRYLNQAG